MVNFWLCLEKNDKHFKNNKFQSQENAMHQSNSRPMKPKRIYRYYEYRKLVVGPRGACSKVEGQQPKQMWNLYDWKLGKI